MEQTIEKRVLAELKGLPESSISKVLNYAKELKQHRDSKDLLKEMHKNGVFWRLPSRQALRFSPVKGKGKPASRILIEDIR